MTWTSIKSTLCFLGSTGRLTVFEGVGTAPSASAVSIDFGAVTQTVCAWSIDSVLYGYGAGAGAVAAQSVAAVSGAGVTTVSATMAAFASVGNASYGATAVPVNTGVTPGSGFAELADVAAAMTTGLETEWRTDNDTSIDSTFALASSAAIIGIELRAIPYVRINRAAAFRTRDRICRL